MPLGFRHSFPDDDDPIFDGGFVIGLPVRGKKPTDTEAASEPTSPPRDDQTSPDSPAAAE
jgi:hypothetical protein